MPHGWQKRQSTRWKARLCEIPGRHGHFSQGGAFPGRYWTRRRSSSRPRTRAASRPGNLEEGEGRRPRPPNPRPRLWRTCSSQRGAVAERHHISTSQHAARPGQSAPREHYHRVSQLSGRWCRHQRNRRTSPVSQPSHWARHRSNTGQYVGNRREVCHG